MPDGPEAGRSAAAAELELPAITGVSPGSAAAFWLADPEARSFLSEQLSELLRRIIEIIYDQRVVGDPRLFSWCPVCGNRLAEYDQPDIWVQGLRCAAGHQFSSRGGRLFGRSGGEQLTLVAEMSDTTVAQVASAWLKPNRHLEPQLHASVRTILAHHAGLHGGAA
jgi:hypothetical protein